MAEKFSAQKSEETEPNNDAATKKDITNGDANPEENEANSNMIQVQENQGKNNQDEEKKGRKRSHAELQSDSNKTQKNAGEPRKMKILSQESTEPGTSSALHNKPDDNHGLKIDPDQIKRIQNQMCRHGFQLNAEQIIVAIGGCRKKHATLTLQVNEASTRIRLNKRRIRDLEDDMKQTLEEMGEIEEQNAKYSEEHDAVSDKAVKVNQERIDYLSAVIADRQAEKESTATENTQIENDLQKLREQLETMKSVLPRQDI